MANGSGKVPILESAREGFRFMRSSLAVIFPAAALLSVFLAAAQVLMDPNVSPNPGLGFVLFVIASLGGIAFAAFLYRLALREDGSGFFGLKFGPDETRLLGVSLAVGFLFFIILVIGVFVLVFAFAAFAGGAGVDFEALGNDSAAAEAFVQSLMSGPQGLLLLALFFGFFGFLIWLSLRLSLIAPATIGEGRMMAFSTFSWTKGNTLRILAAILVLVIPLALVIGVGAAIIGAVLGAVIGADAEAVFTPTPGALAPHAVFQFIVSLGQLLFISPASYGLLAYLYRGLRPPELPAPKT